MMGRITESTAYDTGPAAITALDGGSTCRADAKSTDGRTARQWDLRVKADGSFVVDGVARGKLGAAVAAAATALENAWQALIDAELTTLAKVEAAAEEVGRG
jgi:hypothetical protein